MIDENSQNSPSVSFFSEKQYQCGASIAALRLADSLSRTGADITYNFEVRKPGPSINELFPTIDFTQAPKFEAPAPAGLRARLKNVIRPRPAGGLSLHSKIAGQKTDVAHFHNFSGDRKVIVDLAARMPLVWTMHDTAPVTGYHYRTFTSEDEPLEYKSKLAPANERFWEALKGAPFVLTAPSKWLAGYARAAVPSHIVVRHLPNVVSPSAFYPIDKSQARALVGLPLQGTHILFFAGRSAWKRKNFEVLARALLANPDLDINVVVVGGGAGKALLRDRRFIFMNGFDPVSDAARIVALYNATDAFCISSLIDNLPNTVMEALHCGRPVIAAAAGGVPDMVVDGANGWLFDPRDHGSAAQALRRFMDDRERWRKMGESSLRLAASTFNPDTINRQFLDLYAEFGERHRKRDVSGASG
ncbi:MAG: glycosyltransferase [Parvularculaceae bacterium]